MRSIARSFRRANLEAPPVPRQQQSRRAVYPRANARSIARRRIGAWARIDQFAALQGSAQHAGRTTVIRLFRFHGSSLPTLVGSLRSGAPPYRAKGIARRHAIGLDECRTRLAHCSSAIVQGSISLMKVSFQTVDVFTDSAVRRQPCGGHSRCALVFPTLRCRPSPTRLILPKRLSCCLRPNSANTALVRIF